MFSVARSFHVFPNAVCILARTGSHPNGRPRVPSAAKTRVTEPDDFFRTRKNLPAPGKRHRAEMVGPQDVPFGEVDLERQGTRAYLVKMPAFLLKEFESRPGKPGESAIGRLRIPDMDSLKPTPMSAMQDGEVEQEPRAQIMIDHPVDPKAENPRKYELHFPDEEAELYLMSWKPKGDDPSMRVEGRVVHQCDARPQLDDSYRRINKKRGEDAAQSGRETVFMDEGERIDAQNRAIRVTAEGESATVREERQKKKESSRRHLGVPDAEWKEAIKVALFRRFESKLHYSADELSRDLDEPVSRLRPIINEICVYNKSAPFAGKYELKDEFKTLAQRQQKERELEDHHMAMMEDVKRRREERAQNDRDRQEPSLKKPRYG